MDVLIIGSGGREYSIGLALAKDENVEKIYFAPGNGATDALGENLSISDFSELADFVENSQPSGFKHIHDTLNQWAFWTDNRQCHIIIFNKIS